MNFKLRHLLFCLFLIFCSTTALAQEMPCETFASDAIDAQQLNHDVATAENLFLAALNNKGECKDETLLTVTTNLGAIYANQKRYGKAEPLFREALILAKKIKGENHPDISVYLSNLAVACSGLGKSEEADSLFRNAIARLEKVEGKDSRRLAHILEIYAKFLRKENRIIEADELEKRAKEIQSKPNGHPRTFEVEIDP